MIVTALSRVDSKKARTPLNSPSTFTLSLKTSARKSQQYKTDSPSEYHWWLEADRFIRMVVGVRLQPEGPACGPMSRYLSKRSAPNNRKSCILKVC